MPLGLLIGTAIGGQAFWIVASGSRFLWAMRDPDYVYSELLRSADHDASALLSGLNERALDAVDADLTLIVERLEAPAPDADWERVRKLKAEELGIALALVRGRTPVAESALHRQQELRRQARDEFIAVRKTKSSFWR